jgi:hypothetical protein
MGSRQRSRALKSAQSAKSADSSPRATCTADAKQAFNAHTERFRGTRRGGRRMTLAMAAGLTDRFNEIDDLVRHLN